MSGVAGVPSDPAMKIRSPGCIAAVEGTGAPASTCWKVVRGNGTPAAPQARIVSPEQSHPSGPVPPHRYGLPSWARANATTVLCCAWEGRAKPGGSWAVPPPPGPSPPRPGQSATATPDVDGLVPDVDSGADPVPSTGQYLVTNEVAADSHRATADGNALCWTWSDATVTGSSSQWDKAPRALRNRMVEATGLSRTSAGAQVARCWKRPKESRSP